ncbi:hypothetical protein GGD56_006907 [Rhizobium mongolense]|uniref:Uncharacterized protein n=1 Tax=Rhizobium mongolense TaxID=57676 RepID=A0ABR6IYL1_9HYPH|nr:hypothetical protein [Rhizobium mongolense]
MEETGHFLRRLQITIRIPFTLEADVVDGASRADAGDDILQLPAVRGTVRLTGG